MVRMGDFPSLVFYILAFLISAFLLIVGNIGPKRNKILIGIGLLVPILIAAFRYGVGTDFYTYLNGFYHTQNSPWPNLFLRVSGLEYGYNVIVKTLSMLGDRQLFFGATAAITIIPVYCALRKHYPKASLGLAFFLYLVLHFPVSFNGMRQMMAVSVVFWGIKYIFERNALKFYLTIIFATVCFHSSAVVALPLYFLWDKENNCVPKIQGFLIVGATIAFVFLFQSFFEQLSQMGDSFDRYSSYAVDYDGSSGKNRDLILEALIFVTILLHRKHLVNIDQRNGFLILVLFMSVLFGITGFKSPFVKRIAIFYEIVGIVLLSQITLLYAHRNKPLIRLALVLYAVGVFTLVFFILKQANVIPYRYAF